MHEETKKLLEKAHLYEEGIKSEFWKEVKEKFDKELERIDRVHLLPKDATIDKVMGRAYAWEVVRAVIDDIDATPEMIRSLKQQFGNKS